MSLRILFPLLLLLPLLSACGGSSTPAALPTAAATLPAQPTPTPEILTASTAAPDSTESVVDFAPGVQSAVPFQLSVSGDASLSLTEGLAEVVQYPGDDNVQTYYELYLGDGIYANYVTITLPQDAAVGTLPFGADYFPSSGSAGAGVYLGGDTESGTQYTGAPQGSITLTRFDELAAGSFTFTIALLNEGGETAQQTITVAGSFADVPVLR